MAKARVIIKRRKAVRNIRKITKVMQNIATVRYQKAYKRALGTRPYVQKISEMVSSVMGSIGTTDGGPDHPLMREPAAGKPVAVLMLTSNRGLCGGYNGNITRLATATLREMKSEGIANELHVSGKKGIAFVKFMKFPTVQTYNTLGDAPKYVEIEPLANQFIQDYIDGKISGLKVVYMRFLSAGQQKPVVASLLPLTNLAEPVAAKTAPATTESYEFSPGPAELLAELIPTTVRTMLFQAFIESAVSEQIFRMVAMKAATDAAEKMGKKLQGDYNRARQSQITSELSELMGGVEALK